MSWFGAAPGGGPQGLEMYHVGVVVPDVRAAMERYTAALGFTWTEVGDSRFDCVVDGRRREACVAATYSRQGPPYLEIVQDLSGGVFSETGAGLNHVGFWVDDLAGEIRRLEAAGLPAVLRQVATEQRPESFSYHGDGTGLWWELVSRPVFAPRLQARLDRASGSA